jgi:hypothetical protein
VLELKSRQREIEHRLSSHTSADETFCQRLSALIGLTAHAHECFVCANIEQKRNLLTLIFANLEMQGATLCYSLRKPFDVLAQIPKTEIWCDLLDRLRTDIYSEIIALSSATQFIQRDLLVA